ncbi:Putative uncharacterized protein [Lactococcus lactis subsp. lactis A12]|uniref:Uncharacterized protein n=1 Tax=Lactococcus lactis subsp. lactis A12 TaxID=1137134 RepID=S6F852_LACLL|nr:Putative uncharacterized protein [Lactococcus lactis subsp. lactis A12]SBW30683.1 Hypothetical protein LLA12_01533 [Lactococcus lactis subsp. lactis]
MHGEMLALVNF